MTVCDSYLNMLFAKLTLAAGCCCEVLLVISSATSLALLTVDASPTVASLALVAPFFNSLRSFADTCF
jgi:hypothetical protein